MIDLNTILEGLIKRTAEDQLQWVTTLGEERFVTSVQAIAVAIEQQYPSNYRLEILDESGRMVEMLDNRNATITQEGLLERLYVEARRSALGAQVTLEKLARALNL